MRRHVAGASKGYFGGAFSFEGLGTEVALGSGAPVLAHHEHVLEITYLAPLSAWFSLQPDFQYIINPGGFGRTPNAFVAGIRFNVTFYAGFRIGALLSQMSCQPLAST